jgi:hypothetical protein
MQHLSRSLAKLSRPILIRAQTLFTYTGSDRKETSFEVGEAYRADLIHWCVEESLAEVTEGPHGGVFSESSDVGA